MNVKLIATGTLLLGLVLFRSAPAQESDAVAPASADDSAAATVELTQFLQDATASEADAAWETSTPATPGGTAQAFPSDLAGEVSIPSSGPVRGPVAQPNGNVTPVQFLAPGGAPPVDPVAASTTGPNLFGVPLVQPFGPIYGVERRVGSAPGYDADFTALNMFVPFHTDPGYGMVFLNGIAIALDDNGWAGNLGVGYRRYFDSSDRVLGVSAWFDIDDHQGDFERIGLSFESLGRFLDIRANGYYTLSDDNLVSQATTGPFIPSGNNLLLTSTTRTEYAVSGADVEIGGYTPFLGRYGVNGYVGAYALRSEVDDTIGWKARLSTDITEDVQFNVQHQDDDIFGATTWASFTFRFPGGLPRLPGQLFKARTGKQRFADQVVRNQRIQVVDRVEANTIQATRNGNALFALVVDPDRATTPVGTGTFEDPFSTMEQARQANAGNVNLVYVFPRADGTGTNLAMQGTFNVNPNQSILGGSGPQTITTDQGSFLLQSQRFGAPDPLISIAAGVVGAPSVFNLATGAEIANLRIDGSDGFGGTPGVRDVIAGNNIANFILRDSTLQNGINGANLQNLTGTQGAGDLATITGNVFQNNSFDGLRIVQTNAGTLDLNLSGNTATGNANTLNSGVGFNIIADNSTVNLNDPTNVDTPIGFTNNVATGNGTGAQFLAQNGGTINVRATGNTSSDNAQTGMTFSAQTAGTVNLQSFTNNTVGTGTLNGNPVGGNAADGVVATAGTNGTVNISDPTTGGSGFNGNTISGNAGSGVVLQTTHPSGTVNALIGDDVDALAALNAGVPVANQIGTNVIAGNSIGIEIDNVPALAQTRAGTVNATIQNNEIGTVLNGNTIAGVQITSQETANTSVLVGGPDAGDGNRFTANGTGVLATYNSAIGDPVDLTVQNNTFTNNINAGVSVGAFTTSTGNVLIDSNTITGTGATALAPVFATGISVTGSDGSSTAFTVSNNLVDGTTGDGVAGLFSQGTTATLNVTGNTIQNNLADGVNITTDSQGSPTVVIGGPTPADRNIITGNTGIGVNLLSFAINSAPDYTVLNNLITNNAGGGVQLQVPGLQGDLLPYSFITANIQNNIITDDTGTNPLFGVNLDLTGRVVSNVFVQGNTIDGFTDGILLTANAGYHDQEGVDVPNPGAAGANTNPQQPDNPFLLAFEGYRENYLNTEVGHSSTVQILNNLVRNSADNGLEISVGTYSFLGANIDGNTFVNSGNLDFVLDTLITEETNTSINRANPAPDTIFLDDLAQVSLRFANNIGSSLNPHNARAIYTTADPLKDFDGAGGFVTTNRPGYMLHVELDGLSTNTFIQNGVQTDVVGLFGASEYLVGQPGITFQSPAFLEGGIFFGSYPFLYPDIPNAFNTVGGAP